MVVMFVLTIDGDKSVTCVLYVQN